MRPRFVFILFELCYDLQQTLRRATIRGLGIQIGISDTDTGNSSVCIYCSDGGVSD